MVGARTEGNTPQTKSDLPSPWAGAETWAVRGGLGAKSLELGGGLGLTWAVRGESGAGAGRGHLYSPYTTIEYFIELHWG